MSTPKIYTIGHSNHEIETFINLLKTAKIDMIVDVRSAPFSKMYPHFNRDTLESVLKDNGPSDRSKISGQRGWDLQDSKCTAYN